MRKILNPGSNCWDIFDVSECGVIIDGCDYYKAFYEAALRARRYILLAGWQFDSRVKLLRSEDETASDLDTTLIAFLNKLCEKNMELEIHLLAWDFSVIYAIDREWFQEWVFNWTTNERIHFHFDRNHAIGASHHQKFVVIDGLMAFAGGLDICSNRWDDRRHLLNNPHRIDQKGNKYEPYHDAMTYLSGPAAVHLARLFRDRWMHSGGGELQLPDVEHGEDIFIPENMIMVSASKAALSRTEARTIVPRKAPVQEIRNLYHDAILAADKCIYMENQYFSSQAVFHALTLRMRDPERPKLHIIMVLPRKPHAFIEELSIGIIQAKMLRSLTETAAQKGHSLGIYYSLAEGGEETDVATYIHAKLLIVDDRFLSIGSANTTNRSMGLDTELNISWEAGEEENGSADSLSQCIRKVRISLLTEHSGLTAHELFGRADDLVANIGNLIADQSCRLRKHAMDSIFGQTEELKKLNIESLPFDPEKPPIEENVYEVLSKDPQGIFAQGITFLNDNLSKRSERIHGKYIQGFLYRIFLFLRPHWLAAFIILIVTSVALFLLVRHLLD
ncbi:MAG: phospholipase D-like domain-containing protein [Nitrospirota bacterium]